MLTRHHAQVVLGKQDGGLAFVTADGSFTLAVPWVARQLAVSCVSSEPVAALASSRAATAAGDTSEEWAHILEPRVDARTDPCVPLRELLQSYLMLARSSTRPMDTRQC